MQFSRSWDKDDQKGCPRGNRVNQAGQCIVEHYSASHSFLFDTLKQ